MINHARTLLTNLSGVASGYAADPGAEFVPPDFHALAIPRQLQPVERELFGSDADALTRNYRARQYLALLHATELREYLTQLDPRITYDTAPQDDLFAAAFLPKIYPIAPTPPNQLFFLAGPASSSDTTGRSRRSWRIEDLSGTVRITRQTPPADSWVEPYSVAQSLSEPIPLLGTLDQFRFYPGAGYSWEIETHTRPSRDLGQVAAAVRNLPQVSIEAVFSADGVPQLLGEPWRTFRNLWRDHPEFPYQFGGFLLAWIYRLETLRTGTSS